MQTKADSWLESLTNTIVGFIVAMLTYQFIINPMWGFNSNVWDSMGITSIFMVASIIRQYVIRRVFNGKSIYHGLRDMYGSRHNGR